jgi:hypothetical protein
MLMQTKKPHELPGCCCLMWYVVWCLSIRRLPGWCPPSTLTTNARETGFLQALETAKDIARDMDIDTLFYTRRKIKRKRHFDENLDDTNVETISIEEIFRINYFIPIVNQAISSLTRRSEQYQSF